MANFNENNEQIMDETPVAVPVQFRRQSFIEEMQKLVRVELSRRAAELEMETFEEADDFDVDDDDPWSEYELTADQEWAAEYPIAPEAPETAPESSKPEAGGEVPSPPGEGSQGAGGA